MSLARWYPFRELQNLENEMNRLSRRRLSGPEEALSTSQFVPPADVYEDDEKLSIKLDIPGVDSKDLDIRVMATC